MPYTFQNLVIDLFFLHSFLICSPLALLFLVCKNRTAKKVFGVTFACILPSYLLWVVLHFASNAIQKSFPCIYLGMRCFRHTLSARNRALKKRAFASYWQSLKTTSKKRKVQKNKKNIFSILSTLNAKGNPHPLIVSCRHFDPQNDGANAETA